MTSMNDYSSFQVALREAASKGAKLYLLPRKRRTKKLS
jgi:hypothetical protein